MKKILYFLTMLPVLAFLGACTEKEEIVFDHEQPAFDIRDNAILIEAIMPQGTVAEDIIYIAGAFNGGDAAVGRRNAYSRRRTKLQRRTSGRA